MSNIETKLESISTQEDLFENLNNKSAETISGGRYENGGGKYEVFSIYNQSYGTNPYVVDGRRTRFPSGNSFWVTDKGGIISFDSDYGKKGVQLKRYNLRNGRKYAFRRNTRTSNPYDIDLYDIGSLT